MIDQLLTALEKLLVTAIYEELKRIGRDISETNDGISFFSYPERDDDYIDFITKSGELYNGENKVSTLKKLIADGKLPLDGLDTMLMELKEIDDDKAGIYSVGRAVLETLGLKGKDVVDVVQEDRTLIGTADGRVFSFTVFEVTDTILTATVTPAE